MKFIWNMTNKERFSEGLLVGSIITGVSVMAGFYKPENILIFTALTGLAMINISGLGLIATELNGGQEA